MFYKKGVRYFWLPADGENRLILDILVSMKKADITARIIYPSDQFEHGAVADIPAVSEWAGKLGAYKYPATEYYGNVEDVHQNLMRSSNIIFFFSDNIQNKYSALRNKYPLSDGGLRSVYHINTSNGKYEEAFPADYMFNKDIEKRRRKKLRKDKWSISRKR